MSEYRITFDPIFNTPVAPFTSNPVDCYETAKKQLEVIIEYTKHLQQIQLMPDYCNLGFLEERNPDGSWKILEEDLPKTLKDYC